MLGGFRATQGRGWLTYYNRSNMSGLSTNMVITTVSWGCKRLSKGSPGACEALL